MFSSIVIATTVVIVAAQPHIDWCGCNTDKEIEEEKKNSKCFVKIKEAKLFYFFLLSFAYSPQLLFFSVKLSSFNIEQKPQYVASEVINITVCKMSDFGYFLHVSTVVLPHWMSMTCVFMIMSAGVNLPFHHFNCARLSIRKTDHQIDPIKTQHGKPNHRKQKPLKQIPSNFSVSIV